MDVQSLGGQSRLVYINQSELGGSGGGADCLQVLSLLSRSMSLGAGTAVEVYPGRDGALVFVRPLSRERCTRRTRRAARLRRF